MYFVKHTNIYRVHDYSQHLKSLSADDKFSRFGHIASNQNIDDMILKMCYHPHDHELWYIELDGQRVAWGHMAKTTPTCWELAVSVDSGYQRRGLGNALIVEILAWAKYHHIAEVFMQCAYDNRVMRHLAHKNSLTTRAHIHDELTVALDKQPATLTSTATQLWKEQNEILADIGRLQSRLAQSCLKPILPK